MVPLRPILILAGAALLAACNGAHPPERTGAVVAGPVHFLQQKGPTSAPATVARGVLNVDGQGCLRLNDRALMWPAEAALDLSQPGAVRVYSREEGASVQVGQPVAVLATPESAPSATVCPGPRLAVEAFSPAG